jgi:uncharacterized membrane protein YhaH (DUF805 family)
MLRHLFSFEGRAGPGEWWAVTVATLAVNLLGTALVAALVVQLLPAQVASSGDERLMWTSWFCRAGVCLLTLWPYISVNIRRAHDRGKSGLLEVLLAMVSAIIWLGFMLTPWPAPVMPVAWLPDIDDLPLLMLIVLFYWNGVTPGTEGPNAYGPEAKRFGAVAA